jgi:hypothetical protein
MTVESLWQSILSKSIIEKSIRTKTILLLGSETVGPLIDAISKGDTRGQSDALGFTFFDEIDEDGEGFSY